MDRLIWIYTVCECTQFGLQDRKGLFFKFFVDYTFNSIGDDFCKGRNLVGNYSCNSLDQTQVPIHIQSTLVISNSKGLSQILRDIRTSTYQICRIEEKLIRLTTLTNICEIGLLKIEIY